MNTVIDDNGMHTGSPDGLDTHEAFETFWIVVDKNQQSILRLRWYVINSLRYFVNAAVVSFDQQPNRTPSNFFTKLFSHN